jgi:ketosteroid isomerase-like protein
MSRRAERVSVSGNRSERYKWVLYVVLALAGAMMTFVGARAQQAASEETTFRKLTDNYCAAWSTGNADAPAKFYAKDDRLVFYDLAPFSYQGWKEYHDGVQKEFLDSSAELKLTAGKDLKVRRKGMVAWTTVTMHLHDKAKDGKVTEADVRYTGIWERRSGKWLLVHEQLAAPLGAS